MSASTHEHEKTHWKDQTWRVGNMLHVGLTDSHVHEGLLNGVVVGHIVMFWHQRAKVTQHDGPTPSVISEQSVRLSFP